MVNWDGREANSQKAPGYWGRIAQQAIGDLVEACATGDLLPVSAGSLQCTSRPLLASFVPSDFDQV